MIRTRMFLIGLVLALVFGASLWGQTDASGKPTQDESVPDLQVSDKVRQSYAKRIRDQGNFLELSLKEAIRLALNNNLDIAIENFNEELNRIQIAGTKGFYDPTVSFTVGINSSSSPTTSVLDAGQGIPVNTFDGFTWNSQYTQQILTGGRVNVSVNSNRRSTNSTFSTLNPSFGSQFNVSFVQPLWKGFMQTQTERQLKIQNLDLGLSDLAFEQRVSAVIRQVHDRYWDLVLAIESHDAERRSLDLAIQRFEDSRKRVQIGIEAPIEITSARSEVASREQSTIQAEVGIVDADNDLRNLLAPDPDDPMWNLRVLPTDRPQIDQIDIGLKDAIQLAVQNRPELKSFEKEFEKVAVNRKFYRRQGKPQVDLSLSYGSTGTAGNAFRQAGIDTNGDGIPDQQALIPNPNSPFQGNLADSLSQAFGFDFTNYNVSATVTLPLRNRANRANLANENINERRLQSRRRQQQQQIAVEVRKAHKQIEIQKTRLEAAGIARQLADERLDGENKRFEAGLVTNFEVLIVQRDLADAIRNEISAKIAYIKAVTALRQATYTLVENSEVLLAKDR